MTPRSDHSPTDAIAVVSEGLEIPAHKVPVPTSVSPEMQTIIGAPQRPASTLRPRTIEDWKSIVDASAATAISTLPGLCKRLRVKFETTRLDGVRAYSVTPEDIAPENRNQLLIHVHGGCYVLTSPGVRSYLSPDLRRECLQQNAPHLTTNDDIRKRVQELVSKVAEKDVGRPG